MNGDPGAMWIRPVLGRADDMRAEVWLRCASSGILEGAARATVASGTLTGPQCATAATLPTTVVLVDQGWIEGQPSLVRGVCTEPGFWTPELPNLYRADVTLRQGDEVVAKGRSLIGLRRLGVKGRSLWLDGRRYVPRGVLQQPDPTGLATLRGLSAVAVIDVALPVAAEGEGSATTLAETLSVADRIGVGVILRLTSPSGLPDDSRAIAERIDSFGAHPSVMMVVLPRSGTHSGVDVTRLGRRPGTMLVGQEVDGSAAPPFPADGLDAWVVVLPPDGVPHDGWRQPPQLPVVAAIREPLPPDPVSARAACDGLQARLAGWGRQNVGSAWDWAGYLVT